jgi:hypothetical protein
MIRLDTKAYVERFIENHKHRVKPKGAKYMTPTQSDLYETIKELVSEKGRRVNRKNVGESYEKKHHRKMNLLPSDFCYNLVNVAPDFECKFLVRIHTGKYEFVDFHWPAEERIEKITWSPKGRNVPPELKGSCFIVGEYFKGKHNWDFREIENYLL